MKRTDSKITLKFVLHYMKTQSEVAELDVPVPKGCYAGEFPTISSNLLKLKSLNHWRIHIRCWANVWLKQLWLMISHWRIFTTLCYIPQKRKSLDPTCLVCAEINTQTFHLVLDTCWTSSLRVMKIRTRVGPATAVVSQYHEVKDVQIYWRVTFQIIISNFSCNTFDGNSSTRKKVQLFA